MVQIHRRDQNAADHGYQSLYWNASGPIIWSYLFWFRCEEVSLQTKRKIKFSTLSIWSGSKGYSTRLYNFRFFNDGCNYFIFMRQDTDKVWLLFLCQYQQWNRRTWWRGRKWNFQSSQTHEKDLERYDLRQFFVSSYRFDDVHQPPFQGHPRPQLLIIRDVRFPKNLLRVSRLFHQSLHLPRGVLISIQRELLSRKKNRRWQKWKVV